MLASGPASVYVAADHSEQIMRDQFVDARGKAGS